MHFLSNGKSEANLRAEICKFRIEQFFKTINRCEYTTAKTDQINLLKGYEAAENSLVILLNFSNAI